MNTERTSARKRIPGWLKSGGPIVVSAAILYYYLHAQNWGELLDAMSEAYVPLALLGIAAPQVVMWYAISLVSHLHLKWFHREVPLRDLFFIKGATYLLSLINNPLAGGGFFVYQLRKADISVRKLGGIMLFRAGLALWGFMVYLGLAAAACRYYGLNLGERLNLWVLWGLIIFSVAWMTEAWLFFHHDMNIGVGRLIVKRENEFWSTWGMASRKQWWLTWACMMPPLFAIFLGHYAVALSFGLEAPFFKFMAIIPFVLIISNLPVAMGGFGTTTMAWVMFFPEYKSDPRLLALSLFIPAARLIVRAALGAVSLPFALKELANLPAKNQKRKGMP